MSLISALLDAYFAVDTPIEIPYYFRLKLRSMVVGEKDDMTYIASEECAIRAIEPNVDRIWSPMGGEPDLLHRLCRPIGVFLIGIVRLDDFERSRRAGGYASVTVDAFGVVGNDYAVLVYHREKAARRKSSCRVSAKYFFQSAYHGTF